MKKLTAMLLAVLMLAALIVPASADGIDLSALSWQELIALKVQIDKELTTREEWQEVSVPAGVWKVGEDIPAGKWTIRCKEGRYVTVTWGDKLNESGQDLDMWGSVWEIQNVCNPEHPRYSAEERAEYTIEVKEGYYISIDRGIAVFSPFTGKPSLGFK